MQVTPSRERPFPTPPTPNAPNLESARFANRDTVVLPDEMVIRILMYLGTTDIAVCRRVNRYWQALIDTRHLLARSFYRDCHLTQRINFLADERNQAIERYHSHIRSWLADFGNGGRETAKQLDNILENKYFPEVLFFFIPKLLLNSNELTCQNTATIGHSGAVRDARFSPDGRHLVTVSFDNAAKLWELEGGQWREKAILRHPARVLSAIFSPSGKLLMTTSRDRICKIWRLEHDQWQEEFTIQHSAELLDESFSPDEKHLVTVSDDDYAAKLWEFEGGQWREKVTLGHCVWVMSACFSPDGKHLVATFVDGTVKIWKFDDGHLEEKFIIHDGSCVAQARFSPDGKHLVTVIIWKLSLLYVKLWELVDDQSQEDATIQRWQEKATIEHSGAVIDVCFSLDGKHLVTASSDGTFKICGLEGGKWQVKAIIRHSGLTASASFSCDGKFLVTASCDGTFKICGLEGGKWQVKATIWNTEALTNASFGPDYQIVTTSRDNPAKIWVLRNKENDDNS